MNHTRTCPVALLRHTMSALPSPFRSPAPAKLHAPPGPTLAGNVALAIVAGEPIIQIATRPEFGSSQITSLMPSPFTSLTALACQLEGTPGRNAVLRAVGSAPVNCHVALLPFALRQ